jgi:hypothetical protein
MIMGRLDVRAITVAIKIVGAVKRALPRSFEL